MKRAWLLLPAFMLPAPAGLGDNWRPVLDVHRDMGSVMLSEPWSEALLMVLAQHTRWWIAEWMPPALGVLTVWVLLRTMRELDAPAPLVVLASGLYGTFLFGYVETTQYAAPFAAASVLMLVRYCKTSRVTTLAAGAALWGVAVLWHGVHAFWFPVLWLLPLVQRRPWHAVVALVGPAAWALGLLSLWWLGWRFIPGAATGGGDHVMFARMTWEQATLAVGVLGLSPVALLGLVGGPRTSERALFALLFGAHAALLCVWGFDLGWPADFDLMAALLVTWAPAAALAPLDRGASWSRGSGATTSP